MTNKLPQGWVECELKDFAEVKGGKRLPAGANYSEIETKFPYIRVTNFNNMSVNLNDIKYLTPEIQQKIKNYTISKNDVYISIAGSIGKVGTIPEILDGANLTENAAKIVHNIDKNFLKYTLNTNEVQHQISFSTKSTTQPKLALYRIESLKIKLPPLNEQKRIVEKIEEEFEKIDEGVEKLKLAQEQIKQYRQSVLKSAFEGKLYKTTEWEEKTLEKLTKKIGDVDHKMPKEVDYGIPYISPKDFYGINGINLKNAKKISNSDYEVLSRKIAPEMGDIIFPRYGTIGVLRYVDTNEKFLVSYSCAVIKTDNQKGNRRYLYYYLLSPQIKSQIQKSIRQTTQANIGIQSIKDFKIKIGTLDEQKQIVKEIEKRFEVADEAERVIAENLEKTEQLKQSILKKAFEGRLVPQDPTDEPASALLEKIKAERK